MKKLKALLAVILILSIGFSLLACEKKVNLQTEKDVVNHLEDFFKDEDKWEDIYEELGLYYTVNGSSKLLSSSFAQKEDGHWLAVLHVSVEGYTDTAKTNKGTFEASYVAQVTADGQVTELFIQKGLTTKIYYE